MIETPSRCSSLSTEDQNVGFKVAEPPEAVCTVSVCVAQHMRALRFSNQSFARITSTPGSPCLRTSNLTVSWKEPMRKVVMIEPSMSSLEPFAKRTEAVLDCLIDRDILRTASWVMKPSAAPLQFAPESVSTLQVVWHKRASKIIERLVFPTLLSWTGMAGASYHSCTGQGMPGISVRVLPAPFLVNNFVPTAYVFNSLKPAVRMTRSVCDHFGTTKTADVCSGSLRLQRE